MGLKSMTGFATWAFEVAGARWECVARSVNRRGLDVAVRLPPEIQGLEPDIRRMAQEVCERGDVTLMLERESPVARVEVDEAAARAVYEALRQVAVAVGASPDIPVSVVATFPDVIRSRPPAPPHDVQGRAILDGVRQTLDLLDAARAREGEALERDIRAHLAGIREAWDRIRTEIPAIQVDLLDRTRARVLDLLASARPDGNGSTLGAALAALADRMDVSEEVARMDAHLAEFSAVLEGPLPHGRRLDFLCQEMMREAGTLGAKAQSASLSHLVVSVKTAIERIREQLANVV